MKAIRKISGLIFIYSFLYITAFAAAATAPYCGDPNQPPVTVVAPNAQANASVVQPAGEEYVSPFGHVDWAKITAAYQYDQNTPLNIKIKEKKDYPAYQKIFFSYDSLNGGKVPAVLFMPKPHIKPMNAKLATKTRIP